MKYVNTGVVFQEIPDETTLAINISGCPCRCPGCHSQYLWDDVGEPLTATVLDDFIVEYGPDITCIAFMGGDADPAEVNRLARHVREHYPQLRVAWYSGRIGQQTGLRLHQNRPLHPPPRPTEAADHQPAPLPTPGRRHVGGHHLALLAPVAPQRSLAAVPTKRRQPFL